MNTIRQVAQGMGYLHARGIVIRKLNSKNVYLEPKVKLCVIDYGMAEREFDR
jgi:kinase suppressor of Ras 2